MNITKEDASQLSWLVVIAGAASTFMISTSLYDPINFPKMFVLLCFATWALGKIIVNLISFRSLPMSIGSWAVVAFVCGIFLAAFFTDVSYTAFFGTFQRSDGAFTYIAFGIISFVAMMSFDFKNLYKFKNTAALTGVLMAAYGLIQSLGHDPFKWALLYGPVVGTVGNPDFMSAVLSMGALATVWFTLTERKKWIRWGAAFFLLLEIYTIKKTGSFQGLLAFGVGLIVILLGKAWQLNRRLGLISTVVVGVFSIPALAGIFNIGPFSSVFYRPSIRNRLDYWHAALKMFQAHPIVGVGLDRFGESYGRFAPQVQVVQGQITNNAHNVFLQLLATGGLIVILPYLFLLGIILWTAVFAIKRSNSSNQFELISVLAIWLSLLLISAISIDTIGVTIWFWIAGGVLYAISRNKPKESQRNPKAKKKSRSPQINQPSEFNYLAPILSLVLTIGALLALVPVWRTLSSINDLQSNKRQLSHVQYLQKMDSVAKGWPRNAQTFFLLADLGLKIGDPAVALKYAQQSIEMDSKTNFARQIAAASLENEKKYSGAISYRLQLVTLDPWNTANMLILVKDYQGIKDSVNASAISSKIAQLYPGSADAKAAAALVKG